MPENPGSPRAADVPLARGASDLQLFVVTSTTPTGTDSPFPTVGLDTQTQVFMAPRVVSPAPPLVRTAITETGVEVDLEVASNVPVGGFRLYRTRVFDAARRADSMGAPTVVPAVAVLDGGQPVRDVRSGAPLYSASTTLATGAGWQPSYLRAVAVPDTSGVPEQAIRGLLSGESDIVTVATPPPGRARPRSAGGLRRDARPPGAGRPNLDRRPGRHRLGSPPGSRKGYDGVRRRALPRSRPSRSPPS